MVKYPGKWNSVLQQASMKVVDHQTCYNLNTVKSKLKPVNKRMICAGYGPGNNISGCNGDSGGPFVCKASNGKWELQGVTSWGSFLCDTNEAYSVFARVTEFKSWILQTMQNN